MSEFVNRLAAGKVSYDAGLRSYMMSIYNLMSVALVVTGVSALAALTFPPLQYLVFNRMPSGALAGISMFGYLIGFVPLGIAFYFSFRLRSMSASTAYSLLIVCAVCLGISISPIALIYTGASIARTFFISASVFASMSIYGYTTKRDLTNFGAFLMMGLIGLIIASLVNMFYPSSFMNFAISVIGVLIFTGLAAYETQNIKKMYSYFRQLGADEVRKHAIHAAFGLYISFINLFLYLLRFTGVRRN